MRLVALLLTASALVAQTPTKGLPWDGIPEPPWRIVDPAPPPSPAPADSQSPPHTGECLVSLAGDGALRVSDSQGLVRLRMGLPGRPTRIWRDAGTPVALAEFPCRFPAETPLTRGIGTLPLEAKDFRPALKGLLWILDDAGQILTVVHPATHQVVFLPLPVGQDREILMYPDHLEVRERAAPSETRRETTCWIIPWLGLLPQFVRLSSVPPAGKPGTALVPFPRE